MTPVERVLWLTEAASGRELSLDEFASATDLSRFQIARAFRNATGVPLMAYVRGRRLTDAARRLQRGEPDILMVALSVGYGSHASFTRAFTAHFNLTPDAIRQGAKPDKTDWMERIIMDDQTFELPTPEMRSRDAFTVAGLARVYSHGPAGDIPGLWNQFNEIADDVPGPSKRHFYGLCIDQEDGESFEYVACCDANSGTSVPAPLVKRQVPAQSYAVFTHSGHISNIHKIFQGVYQSWLPNGQFEHALGPDFELYDARFNPATGMGEVEVWIPVEQSS